MDKKISKIKVCCPGECDNTPTEEMEVGNEIHIYCCEKGFLKTMDEFTNSPLKGPHTITDEAIAPRENNPNVMNQLLNGLLIVFRL